MVFTMAGGALRLHLSAPQRVACAPVVVRGAARHRQAVRIALDDGAGCIGWGEALPLPGYSRDAADDAWRVLSALVERAEPIVVPGEEGPCAAPRLAAALAPHAGALAASPSARFALECALLDLLARRAGVGAAAWLAGGRPLQTVPVSVLLPDDPQTTVATARAAADSGHTVVKVKIAIAGRGDADEDQLLAAVRSVLPDGVKLRLDANGALDADQVVDRCAALARHGVECIEEPLAGIALLRMPPLPLPWAADESLADPEAAAALLALPPPCRPAALVLKPAELGIARSLDLAAAAADAGIGVIVTHAFDGDLGFAAACAVAAALPRAPWPCGLAAHAGLRRQRPTLPWLPQPTGLGLGVDEEPVA